MAKISEQLTELINQRDALAEALSAKGIAAEKTEKFNTLISKVNDITAIKGEEKTLEIEKSQNYLNSYQNLSFPENLTTNVTARIYGKNLLDYTNATSGQYMTVTVDTETKSVTSTYTNNVQREPVTHFTAKSTNNNGMWLPAGSYILSFKVVIENTPQLAEGSTLRLNEMMIFVNNTYKTKTDPIRENGTYNLTLPFTINTPSYVSIRWYRNVQNIALSDTTYKAVISELQLEKGTTKTDYEDFITDYTGKNITVSGANLFPLLKDTSTATTQNGVTLQYLSDEDCYLINGTATAEVTIGKSFSVDNPTIPIKNTWNSLRLSTVYVSGSITGSNASFYIGNIEDGESVVNVLNVQSSTSDKGAKLLLQPKTDFINMYWFYCSAGIRFVNYKVKVRLSLRTLSSESYKSSTVYPVDKNGYATFPAITPVTTVIADNDYNVNIISGMYKQITPSADKNGITKAYLPVVDNGIDSYINPAYIRNGITILGITGTYSATNTLELTDEAMPVEEIEVQ